MRHGEFGHDGLNEKMTKCYVKITKDTRKQLQEYNIPSTKNAVTTFSRIHDRKKLAPMKNGKTTSGLLTVRKTPAITFQSFPINRLKIVNIPDE